MTATTTYTQIETRIHDPFTTPSMPATTIDMESISHLLLNALHKLVLLLSTILIKFFPKSSFTPKDKPRCPFPFPGDAHKYMSPHKMDSRSPCPALNTLANHGYLPRNGRKIHSWQLIHALRDGYNLSLPLACFLTWGGYLLLKQFGAISLSDIARHGCIEHNASLAHDDTPKDAEYAPCKVDEVYLDMLMQDSRDGVMLTVHDIAEARVRREIQSGKDLDRVHAEVARGEMALVLGIFDKQAGGKEEVSREMIKEWWQYERFPEGWAPRRQQGLLHTIRTAGEIRAEMKEERQRWSEEARKAGFDKRLLSIKQIELGLRRARGYIPEKSRSL